MASQCSQEELDQATEADPEAKETAAKKEPAAEQAASNENQNHPQQLELKSNANVAPCAGTSNSICAVFNVGPGTSDGSKNGNSSGNVDNGSSINGNGLEKQNKIVNGNDLPEGTDEPATLEPTFPTFVSPRNASFHS